MESTQQVPIGILFRAVIWELQESEAPASPSQILDMLISGELAEYCELFLYWGDDEKLSEEEVYLLNWIPSLKGDEEARSKLEPIIQAQAASNTQDTVETFFNNMMKELDESEAPASGEELLKMLKEGTLAGYCDMHLFMDDYKISEEEKNLVSWLSGLTVTDEVYNTLKAIVEKRGK